MCRREYKSSRSTKKVQRIRWPAIRSQFIPDTTRPCDREDDDWISFTNPSWDKQDDDLVQWLVCVVPSHSHSRMHFGFLALHDIAGSHDGTIFIRSFARPGDLFLILTLFGLLVGGEWWFRRVFYIARFVLFAWDRDARFNFVRTAAGRLLFSVSSSWWQGSKLFGFFKSVNYLLRGEIF